jgi:undecaprenyl-phosphate 4-deoxy-4-formamido-L-arabinose transferase
VPCYRSRDSLGTLVNQLAEVLTAEGGAFEIVLVVDGSPDDTATLAEQLTIGRPYLRVLLLSRNYGQHNALLAGIRAARYDVIVTMDDDLQHLPSEVPRLLRELDSPDVDLVYGVADVEEHGVLRSFGSRSVKTALAAAGVPNARDVSAFRAFRTRLRDAFATVQDPSANVDVLLAWATTSVASVRVRMERRQHGRSNYSPARLVRHSFDMITGYSDAPLRLVTYLGFTCALLGLVLLAVVIYGFVTGRTTVAGFTTVASMVALFSGAQMLSIGILGEYVGRLHFRGMGRPTYLISREIPGVPAVVAEGDARDSGTRDPSVPTTGL